MAESDKADASTGKTKAKASFLDDDISKDFLSSWKSTGGSDMDFNFEPVAKGNKKAFDFGMDMDFSLDDAFGKMPSFKLDMPDIDFSSSPKKSSVSKENKSEREPAKESGQKKNDKFTFSFDFDGFGDFSLDEPATKGGKNANEGKTSKQASSVSNIECKDLPNQAASNSEPRKEDATQKEHLISEVAVETKDDLSAEQETSLGASSSKGPSNFTIAVHQQKETQMSVNQTVPLDALQPDPESPMAGETDPKISKTQARAHDFSSNPESNPSHMIEDSEEAFAFPKMAKITSAEGVEEDFRFTEKKTLKQVSAEVKDQAPMVKVSEEAFASLETDRIPTVRGMEEGFHLTEEKALKQVFDEVKEQAPMVKVSEEAFASPETDRITTARCMEEDFHLTEEKTSKQVFAEVKEQAPMVNVSALLGTGSKASDDETFSPNEKIDDGTSEVGTLQEECAADVLLGTDSITTTPDRSSPLCLTEKVNFGEEERVAGVVQKLDNHTLTLDTVACKIAKRMNSEVSLNAKLQKSDSKDPPAPSDSEPTNAKSMKMRFKLPEANTFSVVRGTNDGAGKTHFILEKSKKGSASLGAADLSGDPSNKGNGGKLDGNPSSCAKELRKRDSAIEIREKSTAVLRDGDSNESGDIQTKTVVDAVLGDGQAKKDSFRLLDRRKTSIDVKPYSIQLPSLVAPEWEAKSSNQGSGKLKDKISSISTAQKSNTGQVNRLLSAKTDKTVPTLPSLKISRNTVNKQSSTLIVQTPKSMVNFEKSARLQDKTKIVSPVNVQRQTPSVTSLKRKLTEVADPQPSKRHLVSESRMCNVSPREVEKEVKTRVTLCEGSKNNVAAENPSPKFDFHLEENLENLGFTLMVESDGNVEKAEACAKELDDICSMLKKKHDEAKELLVRALVNNNNLLMLNHPIYERKILEVQKFASRLMSREQAACV